MGSPAEVLINFFFPPRCASCLVYLATDQAHHLCASCMALIDRIKEPFCQTCGIPFDPRENDRRICRRCVESPPAFTRARSVAKYAACGERTKDVLGALIRRHKYGFNQSAWRALADCIGDELPLCADNYDLVVPVPLHRKRLRWRGFNQAALLAADVAARMECDLDVRSLVRVRATPPQTDRDPRARQINVRGAFRATARARTIDRRILLIDDVFTTGATVNECARTLLEAGAQGVDVLTLARAV